MTHSEAKQVLKQRGWSYRRAAKYLGVNPTHLTLVCCGHRVSKSLLNRIAKLPHTTPPKRSALRTLRAVTVTA